MKRPLFWIGLTLLSSTAVFLRFSVPASLAICLAIALFAAFLAADKFNLKRAAALFIAALSAGGVLFLRDFVSVRHLAPVTDTSDEYAVICATVTESLPGPGWHTLSAHADISVGTVTRTTDIKLSGSFSNVPKRGEVICCLASYKDGRYTIAHFINHDGSMVHPHITLSASMQHAIGRRLDALFDNSASAVLSAVIVGDDSKLDSGTLADFRGSSLSHLLVVSGMHLLIISHSLSLLLGSFLSKRMSSVISLLFCWVFASLSGFGVSIVRAALMITIMNVGALIGRKSDTLTSMMTAALLIVLFDPVAVTSSSFLLSFSAVAGLALLQKPITALLCGSNSNAVIKSLVQSVSSAAAAQLATAPVCIILFKTVPLIGVAANMAAVWLLQPIMLLGVLSLIIAGLFQPLAIPLIFICEKLITLLLSTAKFFASIPFVTLYFTEYWQFVWLIGALLLAITVMCRASSRSLALTSAVGLSAVYVTASLFGFVLDVNRADILIFEQSDCAAVIKGRHAVLLGSPNDRYQRTEIANAFSSLGVEQLDAIVITDSHDLNYNTVKLSEDFYCHSICAPNDRTSASFCHSSGLKLCALAQNSPLFEKMELTADTNGYQMLFKGGKLLKNKTNCDIIGRYSYPLQTEGAMRYKIAL